MQTAGKRAEQLDMARYGPSLIIWVLMKSNDGAAPTDMLSKGFEWTYKYGEPRNPNPKRYRPSPPCCQIFWPKTKKAGVCNHTWDVK